MYRALEAYNRSVKLRWEVRKPFLLLVLTFFLGGGVLPLSAQQKKLNGKFTHYTTRMGLSSSTQQCIVQDTEGFMWIGTNDGLNRFDGKSFKVYRRVQFDTASVQSNQISDLLVDSHNVLWVGTLRAGLSRYNKETDSFITYLSDYNDHNTLSANAVTALAEDAHGQLWVGTYNGLNLFDCANERFIRFLYNPADPSNPRGIAFDQVRSFELLGDTLWMGYSSGVISALNVKQKVFKHYKLFNVDDRNIKEFMITSICADGDWLWLSTWGEGVWMFNRRTHHCKRFDAVSHLYVNDIFKDEHNIIWIATESNGVLQVDPGRSRITNFMHDDFDEHSLSNNSISKIYKDRQGSVWLCSKKGSLHYMIPDNPFHSWRRNPVNPAALSDDHITCVLEDNKRRLWVGFLNGGIDRFDLKGQQRKITISSQSTNGLGYGTVVTFFQGRDGTIWVGTFLEGLKKYDEKTGRFRSFRHDPENANSISCNSIRQIAEDSRGNLWLATHGGGLDMFDPVNETFRHHRVNYNDTANTINSDWLLSVFCDKDDNIWVGSVSGITVLDKYATVLRHYNARPGPQRLSDENINLIYQDSQGAYWVATNDGLNRIDPGLRSVSVYTTADGLPGNLIQGILEDGQHNLWISTAKGLSKFSPLLGTFRNYFVEDGLGDDEFITASCFKNIHGEMYFGAREGLSCFHPDSLRSSAFEPPVYITDFRLFNRPVEIRDGKQEAFVLGTQIRFAREITLQYDQNIIGFEFVALDYRNPGKNQFMYMMDGFDKDWSQPGSRQDVTYTNLHPGKYTFRVKASSADGVWNERGTSVDIVIKPPLWKTPWAYTFYFVLAVSLMYGFRQLILRHAAVIRKLELEELEIEKLHEMDAQKMQFFSNISHEFRTPLTLITGPLENLLKNCRDQFQQTQLNIIYRNTTRLLRLINQLMDFRKLETSGLKLELAQHDVIQFIKMVANTFMLEARQRNINFSIVVTPASLVAWFDRDKLEKILYNLIGNAFKFTPDSGKIVVSVAHESLDDFNHVVRIVVEDSGIGIPPESISRIFDRFYQAGNSLNNHGTGIGLSLTKELTELHGGRITVESELGLGSRFTVVIPLQTASMSDYEKAGTDMEEEMFAGKTSDDEETSAHEGVQDRPFLLIIDDNPDMRFYIRSEFKDYRIVDVPDGVTGFEKAITECPDVILCDVMMSPVDGITLCKKLKNDIHTSHIPVVLLTARSSDEHILAGLESGADDYVSKPFNPSILRAKVRNLVELRRSGYKRFKHQPGTTILDISSTGTDEKFLKKVYEIVEKNLANADFDAADFALEVGMSRAQLYRKIQGVSGQSVKEFIRIIRLKKAAEMLLTTGLNISQVAFEVGFNSVAYFTKSFSDYFEVTPTKYISLNKNRNARTINN